MRFAAVHRALVTAAGTALVSSALLITASAPVPAAVHAAAPRPASAVPVLVNCLGHGQVRPSQQVLTCADGNDSLTKLNWSHWGSQALATGTEVANDCTPTCVGGTFRKYPIITVLWRVRPWARHAGLSRFTRATIIYTGTIPPGLHRTRTIPLFG